MPSNKMAETSYEKPGWCACVCFIAKLEAARTDLDWHGAWGDYAINAVFLENYWNEGSVKRQGRWFDNFVISTKPIGPIAASKPPTLRRTEPTLVSAWEAQVATDPEGKDIVWKSRPSEASSMSLTVDGAHGAFTGSCGGKQSLAEMRLGKAATVRRGPYKGEQLSVDHIIPRALVPELDNVIANLELMPLRVNEKASSGIFR
jgi:hypothetical protein